MTARRPRLLVVDPSVAWPEEEGARELIGDWPGDARVLRPALRPGDGPHVGDGIEAEAVVLMGSRASVHDRGVWIADLSAWLDALLDGTRPVPLLGICFGHQLIAHRAGGTIGPVHADGSRELGVRESAFDGSRLVPESVRLKVVASHREMVERLPAGFRVVARRESVPVDGMEHESLPVFSYQFHPEARAGFLVRRGADPSGFDAAAGAGMRRLLAAFRRFALDFDSRPRP